MDFDDALAGLQALDESKMVFRLETTRELLDILGFSYGGSVVHVAGTNGKGSASTVLAAVLKKAGKKVGLYTSPELLDFRERIRVDGKVISKRDFANLADEVLGGCARMDDKPTFFEATTALALLHFSNQGVDAMVLEAGLGGRLDATRAVEGDYCIITGLGYDHMEFLGDSLEEIAWEKAGVISKNSTVVTAVREPLLDIIKTEAQLRKSRVYAMDSEFTVKGVASDLDQSSFYISFGGGRLYLFSKLVGDHMAENISCAAVCAKLMGVSDLDIADGVGEAFILGRMQKVSGRPDIVLDIGHNLKASEALVSFLKKHLPGRKASFVLAFSKGKPYKKMIAALKKAGPVVVTSFHRDRCIDHKKIRLSKGVERARDLGSAINKAKRHAGKDGVVFVTGSNYLVAEALELLL